MVKFHNCSLQLSLQSVNSKDKPRFPGVRLSSPETHRLPTAKRHHLPNILRQQLVGIPVKSRAGVVEQRVQFLVAPRRAKVAPAFDQMRFVAFADQGGAGEGPGDEFQAGQRSHQAHGVFGQRFLADAGAFAAF